MMVGTFQKNGIPEPVPQPQVDADRCIHISQYSFTGCIDFCSFHISLTPPNRRGMGIKKPRTLSGPEYI
jgi:hypothetical protein